ncbi:MAG: hypothetical protein GOMPHAMPRED_005036 [Gomphillus americanus]|uniref:Uncharacterized protein n=1 Tax=Gomphillus americanus TaxID=1940652 RepID=A0A8H3I4M1_9LECA|nr:MAG: hypothetical protein GOMPHAMPRED_005036 [Gomphillus americanus]
MSASDSSKDNAPVSEADNIKHQIEDGSLGIHRMKDGEIVIEHMEEPQMDSKHGAINSTAFGPWPHGSDALKHRMEWGDKPKK